MTTNPLREHQIRPADSAAEQKRLYESDVARLMARRDEFVEVGCPACESLERRARFTKYGLAYHECTSCATVYVSPRPTPAVLESYYESSENYAFWNAVIFPASEPVRRERIFRPRVQRLVELCQRYGVTRGTVVEVGAGFGTFCEELRASNTFERIIAIEPTPDLAATCRERGVEVIQKRVEDAAIGETADVVASFEVIEHLFRPKEFVDACRAMLRPGGLLVLTCPNIRGFDIDVLGAGSPAVDAEHLNYFHPESLGRLLDRGGFEVLESQTPGKLDADIVRNRVLSGEHTLDNGFLQRVLIDEWATLGDAFQQFLVDQHLSSNMWIVARKRT